MPDETHPSWCATGEGNCGTHLSAPVNIPATAGRYVVDDAGALFPRVEVAAALTGDGAPAVHVAVFDPTGSTQRWASGLLTVAQFRALLAQGGEVLALLEGGEAG